MNMCISRAVCAVMAFTALCVVVFPAKAIEKKKNSPETYQLLNLFGDVFEQIDQNTLNNLLTVS